MLKDKRRREAENKDPRPIAIGSIKNRVVQRAILQILQPRRLKNLQDINTKHEPIKDPRLRKLNQINCSKYGVGGLMSPYGGVKPAIELVMKAMAGGARYYYQSDIKAFFTKIPTNYIVATVLHETEDKKLTDLFASGLEVNLANKSELLNYARLFPSGGIGVAQGSSLSAFAGNLLLYDFDHELNSSNVTAVRYIDDLLIVSNSEDALQAAVAFSKTKLNSYGFSLYKPVPNSDKAAQGVCTNAFNFLGCTLQPNQCSPSQRSIKKLNADVDQVISGSKKAILRLLKKGTPIDPKLSRSAVLHNLGKKIYGWQKSFSFCSNSQEFRKLDTVISKKVSNYEKWIQSRTSRYSNAQLMQILGIPNTENMYLKDQSKNAN